jgi:hypothetical protein
VREGCTLPKNQEEHLLEELWPQIELQRMRSGMFNGAFAANVLEK